MAERSPGIAGLHERIPFLLSQLGVYLAEDFVRRLEPFGVDPRSYAVLKALSEDDGRSQRQLSTQLGIHRNVMVAVVDKLEGQGLVKRLPHPGDRRAFAVTLTDRAREMLPGLDAQGDAQEDEITATLSENDRVTVRRLLQQMAVAAGLTPGVHPKLG
ncbi:MULTISPECIES: MarR family transcriptional regulator [unclassified Mycobacterium]|uniref:MarR family winged helix-turn-helix transcriptional regulator n=1 Tax=unclassified Mycobacterium TaxID=2642494 RepID=UPI00074024D9|nr:MULTISPECIES: MarR family transcriptional regulator [unclassified Mycobacterium]KUH85298.1 MarR family transcriptional regulator [Mycobacterium sp. GA-0227b]KUH87112.1 MarR family transcriptional regulator [Mycobacterium sp. GA-1999]